YLYTGKTSRAIYNTFHDLWEHSGLEPLPFPIQALFASAMADMFNKAELKEYMGPFSGQVSGLIKEIKPAARILEDMVEEAVDILTRRLPESVDAH
ncbi:nitronate monooxygenase, partial [Thermodesulfobacteriota bacterium]